MQSKTALKERMPGDGPAMATLEITSTYTGNMQRRTSEYGFQSNCGARLRRTLKSIETFGSIKTTIVTGLAT